MAPISRAPLLGGWSPPTLQSWTMHTQLFRARDRFAEGSPGITFLAGSFVEPEAGQFCRERTTGRSVLRQGSPKPHRGRDDARGASGRFAARAAKNQAVTRGSLHGRKGLSPRRAPQGALSRAQPAFPGLTRRPARPVSAPPAPPPRAPGLLLSLFLTLSYTLAEDRTPPSAPAGHRGNGKLGPGRGFPAPLPRASSSRASPPRVPLPPSGSHSRAG